MGWPGHVARIGENRNLDRFLVGKTEGRHGFEDRCVVVRIILKWMLNK
jgi:hypothetical protein